MEKLRKEVHYLRRTSTSREKGTHRAVQNLAPILAIQRPEGDKGKKGKGDKVKKGKEAGTLSGSGADVGPNGFRIFRSLLKTATWKQRAAKLATTCVGTSRVAGVRMRHAHVGMCAEVAKSTTHPLRSPRTAVILSRDASRSPPLVSKHRAVQYLPRHHVRNTPTL